MKRVKSKVRSARGERENHGRALAAVPFVWVVIVAAIVFVVMLSMRPRKAEAEPFDAVVTGPEVNMTWAANPAPDIGKYHVYRRPYSATETTWELLGETPETSWSFDVPAEDLDHFWEFALDACDFVGHCTVVSAPSVPVWPDSGAAPDEQSPPQIQGTTVTVNINIRLGG